MNHEHMKNKEFKDLLGLVSLIFGLFLLFLIVSTGLDIRDKLQAAESTITVSDTGTVYAKPDLAVTTFSVITEAETVSEALSENAKKMNTVISFMKDNEIEEKDLKTTNFSIYPRYEWDKSSSIYPEGERVLVGYEVSQSLQVKIRNLDAVGSIIEGAADSGANQIGSLQFTIDNSDELKDQAREEAITKAKDKAEELAKQLGIRLIRIKSFNESGGSVSKYAYSEALPMYSSAGSGDSVSIESGENKIEVTVSITYDIR